MNLKPFNRHILVELQEEELSKEDALFVMPDDYKPPKSPYVICEIVSLAEDCSINLNPGDVIVVDRTTLKEIKANLETIYLVQENYVYGRVENEIN